MYADIIIKNGRCVTMCGDGGADWVAAAGKMICAAGRGDDWQKLVRPGTQVIDARGGTVLPGFIDNHFHVMQTAVNMMSVDLGGATSPGYNDIKLRRSTTGAAPLRPPEKTKGQGCI